ncbi:N-methyl-L-tryptophan oxidase [Shimazuella kribbensis]|uniref:N-methyl-L-tryptophan oxidase n=1 Tax=Shimazuella kribbensis TaxID=139808 RepID=UPI0003FCEACA|nr:N-methyl-L-tryptophan oxidase [Shimazuella kribbensis]
MISTYDVIIIGSGSMGMAAGYYLANHQIQTLLIDSFDPPHSFGSHHGDTRLYRYTYDDPTYIPLALRAKELWDELEEESGQSLFLPTGVLSIGPPDHSSLVKKQSNVNSFGLSVENLTKQEIQSRWPGFQIPDEFIGLYEGNAGILFSETCIQTYRNLAVKKGAKLQTNTPVSEIICNQDQVTVKTVHGDTFYANKLIVSAGAWNAKLLSNLSLPLHPIRKTVSWFPAKESFYNFSKFPGFILFGHNENYYGFPSIHESGIKIGNHLGGTSIDPDHINRDYVHHTEEEKDLQNIIQTYFPHATPTCTRGSVCMYTMTPDEHFILDEHPQYSNVWIAAGFSGHGYKFASAIGEILSQWAQGQTSDYDLSLFSLDRFH